MRQLFTCLCLCLLSLQGFCGPVFNQLAKVNQYWLAQKDIDRYGLEANTATTNTEWIRLHLTQVEKTLRNRSTAHLTPEQKANRLRSLNDLHQYMLAGNFPVNDEYSYQTPIFIDKYDNFCAVGYLVKSSGHEQVSRMIAAQTNLAYVKQMRYPELAGWARDYGFTTDELAWIQPAYMPARYGHPVAGGTDGVIHEMHADNANSKLYVGGAFSKVNKTTTANNIAYLTGSAGQFTWHTMGAGLNGPVYAIAEHSGLVYAAGAFTMSGSTPVENIAHWDGSSWHPVGCIYGTVKDLVVFNNKLYSVGDFDVCAALAEVNFAVWEGYWQHLAGLDGHVNTIEVMDTVLVLGGSFTYLGTPTNLIKWNENMGFMPFTNAAANEVKDIQKFKDTVYAVCKHTAAGDTNLVLRLNGDTWAPLAGNSYQSDGSMSVNTLCPYNDTLAIGGRFAFYPGMFAIYGPSLDGHAGSLYPPTSFMSSHWITLDSTVNKMVLFKNKLMIGGAFKYGNEFVHTELNSITYQSASPTSVYEPQGGRVSFNIYPNPANGSQALIIENDFNADRFILRDISGKTIISQPLNDKKQSVSLPALSSGVYMGELTNKEGQKMTKKLTVD